MPCYAPRTKDNIVGVGKWAELGVPYKGQFSPYFGYECPKWESHNILENIILWYVVHSACCVMLGACCLLSTACCVMLVEWCLLSTAYYMVLGACCPRSTAWCMMLGACCLLFATCCVVPWCILFVHGAWCVLRAVPAEHVTPPPSPW